MSQDLEIKEKISMYSTLTQSETMILAVSNKHQHNLYQFISSSLFIAISIFL